MIFMQFHEAPVMSAPNLLICTGYQVAWPLPACPASPVTPALTTALPFSPLYLCTPLTPSWLSPPNPLPISNVRIYAMLPLTTSHTGQALRGSCLCAPKALNSLHCHDWFSGLSPSVDCELLENTLWCILILPPLQTGDNNCTHLIELL